MKNETAIPSQGLPSLSKSLEDKIFKNQRELSLVYSNLATVMPKARTIYVTSCFKQEGKTTAAISLACGIATHGPAKVLLADGNITAPQIHTLFDIASSPGFYDLKNSVRTDETFYQTAYKNLYISPIGKSIEREGLRSGDIISGLIEKISNAFDFIIVDGESIMESSGAIFAASTFDATIIVAQCENTKWDVVNIASEKIRASGGKIGGMILNKRQYYIPRFFYRKK